MNKEVVLVEGTNDVYRVGRKIFPDQRGFFRELLRLNELDFSWSINTLTHHRLLPKREMPVNVGSGKRLVYPVSGYIEMQIPNRQPPLAVKDDNRIGLLVPRGESLRVVNPDDKPADVLIFSEYPVETTAFSIENTRHGLTLIRSQTVNTRYGSYRQVYDIQYLNKYLETGFQPVQINHSRSDEGVFRGFHAEAWDKLVYPATGSMVSALVWVGSKIGFGDTVNLSFSEYDRPAVYIPQGWANSICVPRYNPEPVPVEYVYAVGAYWTPDSVRDIRWDPEKIPLPITNPLISEKDSQSPPLDDFYKRHYG